MSDEDFKTMSVGQLKEILEDVPDDYEVYVNYDVFIYDPIMQYEIDEKTERITLS